MSAKFYPCYDLTFIRCGITSDLLVDCFTAELLNKVSQYNGGMIRVVDVVYRCKGALGHWIQDAEGDFVEIAECDAILINDPRSQLISKGCERYLK